MPTGRPKFSHRRLTWPPDWNAFRSGIRHPRIATTAPASLLPRTCPSTQLPLPDEPSSLAQPDSSSEDRACISSDGSWSWKDCHLTPEESRAADLGLAKRHNAEGRDDAGSYGEHGLTPAMRRVEAQLGCRCTCQRYREVRS